MAKKLEHDGYKLINSVKCNDICNDSGTTTQSFKEKIFRNQRVF